MNDTEMNQTDDIYRRRLGVCLCLFVCVCVCVLRVVEFKVENADPCTSSDVTASHATTTATTATTATAQ